MSERSAEILAEALSLADADRARIAEDLLKSLDGAPSNYDAMTEDEFIAELDRRSQELRDHPERGIPWDQVKEMR